MSLVIAIPGSGLAWPKDYEPASNDSRNLQLAWSQKQNYLQGSASDWLPSVDVALRGIRNDCGIANWDGEDAYPVAAQTIELTTKITQALFAMLPRGTPAPDLVPEADGEISIGWTVDADHMFSLSVGDHNKINFAGQFGAEGGTHGWQPIDATSSEKFEKSLEEVVRQIGRLYPVTARRRST